MTAEEFIQYRDLLKPVIEAIEETTEKVQELLERVECIDNSLDDMKEQNENIATHTHSRLDLIIQQGRP